MILSDIIALPPKDPEKGERPDANRDRRHGSPPIVFPCSSFPLPSAVAAYPSKRYTA